MLTRDQIDVIRQNAEVALTSDYGYPVARAHCARHVLELLDEVEQLRATLAASAGDLSALRRLAGLPE